MASISSNSPCAACKFLRRKCTSDCVFAPYFPPEEPQKFANVHKIFGASNVTKILNDLAPHQREDAVNSLAYEAEARLKDPVYGCVGAISVLQRQVQQLQKELAAAHADLIQYTSAAEAVLIPHSPGSTMPTYSRLQMIHAAAREQQQQNLVEFPNSREEPQLTREQLLELAMRIGGSYEAGLAALGMTNAYGLYPSPRPASDGGSGSSGGSFGHLSPP
jgi:hypothetical protein